jgi:hypothetical protein
MWFGGKSSEDLAAQAEQAAGQASDARAGGERSGEGAGAVKSVTAASTAAQTSGDADCLLKSAVQLASDFRHALRSSGTEGPKQPRVAESLPAAKTGRRGQVQEGIGGVDVVVAEVHVEDTARTRGGGVQEGGASVAAEAAEMTGSIMEVVQERDSLRAHVLALQGELRSEFGLRSETDKSAKKRLQALQALVALADGRVKQAEARAEEMVSKCAHMARVEEQLLASNHECAVARRQLADRQNEFKQVEFKLDPKP